MSFDDLLRSLVMENEEVVTPREKYVNFTCVTLMDENDREYRKFHGGRALLTTKRILLLSTGYQRSNVSP